MVRKNKDFIKERKENIAYNLLFLFVCMFIVKLAFGLVSGSKALLVSGIFAFFGIFVSVITLLRIHDFSIRPSKKIIEFSYGKLEFIIITGLSLIIVISTISLLFSIVHMTFFHTLYPPRLIAAWISVVLAAVNLYFSLKLKEKIKGIEELDVERISFLLDKDFILSVAVVLTVAIARSGFTAIDYILAILEAVFIIGYSIFFLYNSLKGLMDASCDGVTLAKVSRCIKKADASLSLDTLRVSVVGKVLEIVAIIDSPDNSKVRDLRLTAKKINHALKENLSMAHEVHVGFKERKSI